MLYDIKNKMLTRLGNGISYESNNKKYYCDGIFFIEGYRAGYDSLKKMADEFERKDYFDFINYYGAYTIIVEDENGIVFFSDNSNLRCMYYSNELISNEFKDAVKGHNKNVVLNEYSIYQYFQHDCIYSDETIVEGINTTLSEYYYCVKSNEITKKRKSIGDLNSIEYRIAPEKFSEIMKYSLAELNKSISLTGGYDSRYVLSMLLGSENLNTGISTSNLNHEDVIISREVACIAGINNHNVVCIEEPKINEKKIIEMWQRRNCSIYSIAEYIYRLNVYLEELKKLGVECLITGDTGIFHKSEDWYQELPCYNKKNCNKKSYYKKRIIDIKTKLPLSDRLKEFEERFEKDSYLFLKENEQSVCTKSIDWYNWYYTRGLFYLKIYTNQSYILNSYAPMMEYRFVINSYNLPRRERMAGSYIKKYITKTNSQIARIKTVTKVTTSSEKKYIFVDTVHYIINLCKAVLRLFGKKVFKKVWFSKAVMNWDFSIEIRKMDVAKEAFEFAKKNNWLNKETKIEKIDYKLLCKVIEVYLIKNYI